MKIAVTIRHEQMNPVMKDYAHEKVEGLEKYFDRITRATLVIEGKLKSQRAELIVLLPKGITLVAKAKAFDIKEVIDGVTDKMIRQISKSKKKMQSKHHTKANAQIKEQ